MSVKLAYSGEIEYNNTKFIILKGTLTGNYGTNGVGDLLNLAPSQNNGTDGGITDPNFQYYSIVEQPPGLIFPVPPSLGGSYVAILPNATPTLTNFGLLVYEPGGTEKSSAAAYTAAELAGFFYLLVGVPVQQ